MKQFAFILIVGFMHVMYAEAQVSEFVRIGNEALNQRKYEIAIEQYNKALMLDAKAAPQAIFNRGIAYSRLGKDSAALYDFDIYLELFPDNPTTYTARGVLFHKMGKKAEALADLTRAVELDSLNSVAWAALGDTYLTMSQRSLALQAWEKSVKTDPKGPYANHVREQIERLKKSVPQTK
ncbi:MAG: tetratricopeptide repeat protein [bacterium]|nr:tetratricopeptide repeat protein [bacterium]